MKSGVIVTGGAGFIGSNIVRALNDRGITNILIVDRLTHDNLHNLTSLKFADFVDFDDPTLFETARLFQVGAELTVFHQGACTNTLERDIQKMMDMNHVRSKLWLDFCNHNEGRLIYASSAAVYGSGEKGFTVGTENPLNVYGFSKLAFDRVVLSRDANAVGLRYFNVYGPGEQHKGKMASSVFQFAQQAKHWNQINLFIGSQNFSRDFIHVDDVVDVNMFFFSHRDLRGIFNCGTGVAVSFADLAKSVIDVHASLHLYHNIPAIREIKMPDELAGQYQKLTRADVASLRSAGYKGEFKSVAVGVEDYVKKLW